MHGESLLFSFHGQTCCLVFLIPVCCWPPALKKELGKHMDHVFGVYLMRPHDPHSFLTPPPALLADPG